MPDKLVDRYDERPSVVERIEFLSAPQTVVPGPNVPGLDLGPKTYSQVFKATEWSKVNEAKLLVSDHLKGEIPQPKAAYVRLKRVAWAELSIVDGDSDI